MRSILLIATKYQVDFIRQRIVKQLEEDWPQTIDQWERLEAEVERAQSQHRYRSRSAKDPGALIDDIFPEPASAICLARECNIPSILPAAFYHLTRINIEDDWDSAHRKKDDAAWVYSGIRRYARMARWSLLSAEDLRCLMLGKSRILEQGAVGMPMRDCGQPLGPEEFCPVTYEYSDGLRDRVRAGAASDIFKVYREVMKEIELDACGDCANDYGKAIDRHLKALWRRLPEFFALQ